MRIVTSTFENLGRYVHESRAIYLPLRREEMMLLRSLANWISLPEILPITSTLMEVPPMSERRRSSGATTSGFVAALEYSPNNPSVGPNAIPPAAKAGTLMELRIELNAPCARAPAAKPKGTAKGPKNELLVRVPETTEATPWRIIDPIIEIADLRISEATSEKVPPASATRAMLSAITPKAS